MLKPATSEIACLKHSILSTNIATLIFQGSISRQSANTYAFFRWKPSRLPVDSNTPGRLSFSGRVHDFLCQDIVQYPWIEHIVSTYIIISGWWFGKNIFPYIGNNHPNWRTPSFFRGVGIPPTRCYISIFMASLSFWGFLSKPQGSSTTEMIPCRTAVQGVDQGWTTSEQMHTHTYYTYNYN